MLPETRQGLVTATATVAATLLAFWLELDNPWWAAFSAHNISHGDHRFVVRKGIMRLAGTVMGVWIGYELALAFEGVAILQATAIFAVAYFATRQRFRSQYDYAWLMFMLMIVMMVFVSILEPGDLRTVAYARIIEVSLGVVVCAVVNHFMIGGVAKPSGPGGTKQTLVVEVDRLAMMAACLTLSVPILWDYLELPSMIQIAVTILAMVDRDLLATRERSGMRLLGCFLGGFFGLAIVGMGFDLLWAWSIMFFIAIAVAGRLYHSTSRFAYAGKQANLAMIMTMVTGSGPPDSIMPVIDRFAGIVCGTILVIAFTYLFAPKGEEGGGG